MLKIRPDDWDNIPQELRALPQWVVWKYEERADGKGNMKRTKVLYRPLSSQATRASSTDPDTWGAYGATIAVYEACDYDGIGFVLSPDDPFVSIDLDDCIDPESGKWADWARDIVGSMYSYSEQTPSGKGVHIFIRGAMPDGKGRRKGDIEIYDRARFMTVTGWHIEGTPTLVQERQEELDRLYSQLWPVQDPAAPPKPGVAPRSTPTALTDDQIIEYASRAANGPTFVRLWRGDDSSYPSQSEADLALLNFFAFYTQSYDQLDRLMRSSGLGRRNKWSERADYRHRTINKALAGVNNRFGDAAVDKSAEPASDAPFEHAPDGDARNEGVDEETGEISEELPTIIISNRPMRDISLDAMNVLVAANAPPELFIRSAELARVRSDENSRPVIEALSETHLRGRLARIATFIRKNNRDSSVHVAPPMEIVRDVLTLGEWAFPALEAVVESPTLRPDGSILDTPGYDAATRLYYMPAQGLTMPTIESEPGRRDVDDALVLLHETLGEFPYVDDASWANTLALLLTPIVRPVIRGHVPLALIDAPRAGTGKGLLNDSVALIATGRQSSIMTAPKEEEEWRKKITSALVDGGTMITIDNVEYPLNSSSLAAALTAAIVQDRVLGSMRMVRVPQRATWVATGNNIRLGGDIPRRCYWIRLDSQTSRPWTRTGFKHANLNEWVHLHRGELLAALLVMARAWFVAGAPAADVPQIGSFEEWTRTVSGILQFAGVRGFLGNINEFWNQTDEEATQWEGFLTTWHECFGEDAITITQLCDALATGPDALSSQQQPELLAALPDTLVDALEGNKKRTGSRSFRTKLGMLLGKKADVRYGDFRLKRASEDLHTKVARWKVKKFET